MTKPAQLSTGAGSVWDRLAPIATALGTLTAADVWAFSTLCELQSTIEIAATQKDEPATRIAATKLLREYAAIIRPYYAMFSLTPYDRTRNQVPPLDHIDTPRAIATFPSKWQGILK